MVLTQRSHSEACSLKKCTLPYINFVFKCLVLYFGIKKEWLEKSLNTFSLAANILKANFIVGNNSVLNLFQTVTKTISRPIAPAPGAHGGATAIKPVAAHQISGLAPAALKKGNHIFNATKV